ncbi:DNA repair protein RecO [Moraxella bovis]|uniref:DNA repair protein RecO n=1 Tax=Moraxella bovis TaxID=476 RepID=UPI002227C2A3|nr:recombination protein O N-terminal domain-containing protein [Moraxella bovis]UYZ80976.1 recombination protein O N-terminal domain-containing protein [Moraxella bovis]
MKNEPLTGYLLHARAYQEKRAIYQFFSAEHGVVHGVGVRGMPSFAVIELFASGQNTLKNFTQIHITTTSPPRPLGQNQYALLYLNELICRLIAPENPCPALWQHYHDSVTQLQAVSHDMGNDKNNQTGNSTAHKMSNMNKMKRTLRQFERALFDELGVGIDWGIDETGQAIDVQSYYDFIPTRGFVSTDDTGTSGAVIRAVSKTDHHQPSPTALALLGQIHRAMIDYLLDYKPLNSRKLWAEQVRYRQLS